MAGENSVKSIVELTPSSTENDAKQTYDAWAATYEKVSFFNCFYFNNTILKLYTIHYLQHISLPMLHYGRYITYNTTTYITLHYCK